MTDPKRKLQPVRKVPVDKDGDEAKPDNDQDEKLRKRMLVLNRKMKPGMSKQDLAANANEWMDLNAKLKGQK